MSRNLFFRSMCDEWGSCGRLSDRSDLMNGMMNGGKMKSDGRRLRDDPFYMWSVENFAKTL